MSNRQTGNPTNRQTGNISRQTTVASARQTAAPTNRQTAAPTNRQTAAPTQTNRNNTKTEDDNDPLGFNRTVLRNIENINRIISDSGFRLNFDMQLVYLDPQKGTKPKGADLTRLRNALKLSRLPLSANSDGTLTGVKGETRSRTALTDGQVKILRDAGIAVRPDMTMVPVENRQITNNQGMELVPTTLPNTTKRRVPTEKMEGFVPETQPKRPSTENTTEKPSARRTKIEPSVSRPPVLPIADNPYAEDLPKNSIWNPAAITAGISTKLRALLEYHEDTVNDVERLVLNAVNESNLKDFGEFILQVPDFDISTIKNPEVVQELTRLRDIATDDTLETEAARNFFKNVRDLQNMYGDPIPARRRVLHTLVGYIVNRRAAHANFLYLTDLHHKLEGLESKLSDDNIRNEVIKELKDSGIHNPTPKDISFGVGRKRKLLMNQANDMYQVNITKLTEISRRIQTNLIEQSLNATELRQNQIYNEHQLNQINKNHQIASVRYLDTIETLQKQLEFSEFKTENVRQNYEQKLGETIVEGQQAIDYVKDRAYEFKLKAEGLEQEKELVVNAYNQKAEENWQMQNMLQNATNSNNELLNVIGNSGIAIEERENFIMQLQQEKATLTAAKEITENANFQMDQHIKNLENTINVMNNQINEAQLRENQLRLEIENTKSIIEMTKQKGVNSEALKKQLEETTKNMNSAIERGLKYKHDHDIYKKLMDEKLEKGKLDEENYRKTIDNLKNSIETLKKSEKSKPTVKIAECVLRMAPPPPPAPVPINVNVAEPPPVKKAKPDTDCVYLASSLAKVLIEVVKVSSNGKSPKKGLIDEAYSRYKELKSAAGKKKMWVQGGCSSTVPDGAASSTAITASTKKKSRKSADQFTRALKTFITGLERYDDISEENKKVFQDFAASCPQDSRVWVLVGCDTLKPNGAMMFK